MHWHSAKSLARVRKVRYNAVPPAQVETEESCILKMSILHKNVKKCNWQGYREALWRAVKVSSESPAPLVPEDADDTMVRESGDRCILIWNVIVAYRKNIDSIIVLTKSK